MLRPGQVFRVLYINIVLVRHRLDDLILAIVWFRPVRFLRYLMPWNWFRAPARPRGERVRLALEDLGPIFVKFGQMLSTRRDLLPDDVAFELAKLQDRVPPFAGRQARAIVEKAYGQPLDQIFSEFDELPLASASIAQVHAARLLDGREVVVKVVRPNIEKIIGRDMELLHIMANLAERYWKESRRFHPREVVDEYETIIFDELDLMREAANASQLRRNFISSPYLYIPEVYWHQTRRNVMVMERIYGIPIGDIEELKRRGVDLKILAERGVEIFFTQVFRDRFFHADMHPGNIFVDATDPQNPCYIAVDFGIVGTLSPVDERYLAENFLAFFHRDYRRVAELHIESGWVPSETRVDEFEAAIRTVSEPIFDRPLKEISFGVFLLSLFQTARRFNMEVQPQLVLLQKTLLNIEGLGRQLYPELDLWKTAKPPLERWMKERMGAMAFVNKFRDNLPRWAEQLPELPGKVHKLIERVNSGEIEVRLHHQELDQIRQELRRANRRNFHAVVGAALIISAALLMGLDGLHPVMLGGVPLLTWILGSLGVLIVLSSWPGKT